MKFTLTAKRTRTPRSFNSVKNNLNINMYITDLYFASEAAHNTRKKTNTHTQIKILKLKKNLNKDKK